MKKKEVERMLNGTFMMVEVDDIGTSLDIAEDENLYAPEREEAEVEADVNADTDTDVDIREITAHLNGEEWTYDVNFNCFNCEERETLLNGGHINDSKGEAEYLYYNPLKKHMLINGNMYEVDLKDYNGYLNIDLESIDGLEDFLTYNFSERTSVIDEDNNSRLVWGKDNDGFIHFGSVQKTDRLGHKAGYIWSSRASVFNALDCEQSMECTLNNYATAIPIDMVKQIINEFKKNLDIKLVKTTEINAQGIIEEVGYHIILPHHWKYDNGKRMWDFEDYTYNDGSKKTSEIIYG